MINLPVPTKIRKPKKRTTTMPETKAPAAGESSSARPTLLQAAGAAEFSSKNLPATNWMSAVAVAGSGQTPAPSQASIAGVFRDPPETVDPLLVRILRWRRRHDTPGEKAFCDWLVQTLKEFGQTPVKMAGDCISVVINIDGKMPTTLFSSHVDTVDRADVTGSYEQDIVYDANFGHIFLDKAGKNNGTCLGADDGVGVWIMLRMIEAKVPGTYIFHRGEECGGIGAKAVRNGAPGLLRLHKRAVAFDRPDSYEVICTQGGAACASIKFGAALATALSAADDMLFYKVSHSGVYTDVKEYRGLIPECVNLGVGYTKQHGPDETLDYSHAVALLEAVKKVSWETLPTERVPVEEASQNWNRSYPSGAKFDQRPQPDFSMGFGVGTGKRRKKEPQVSTAAEPKLDILDEVTAIGSLDDLASWILDNESDDVAKLIVHLSTALAAERARNNVLSNLLGL